MSHPFWAFAGTAFLAVVLFLWGLASLWRRSWGQQRMILTRRWQSLSPHSAAPGAPDDIALPRRQAAWLGPTWQGLPGAKAWAHWLQQTGLPLAPGQSLIMALVLLLGSGALGLLLGLGKAWSLGLMVMGMVGPWWFLMHRRRQKIVQMEAQLPDVLDLIARSMLAGHAFTSALLMAADDAKPPLSSQLHKVFDEIHFGLDLRQAMSALAQRVESDDVRFFVISVLVQHETGGNLADVLKNTASLIRERQKMRGVIRVLSGEGRISAWILSLLPFALAGLLNLVNPEFMSALWRTPQGLSMLNVSLVLMLTGIVWMWRLIDIRL